MQAIGLAIVPALLLWSSASAVAESWIQVPLVGTNFDSVSCSADGAVVLISEFTKATNAPADAGTLFVSTNSGRDWYSPSLTVAPSNYFGPTAVSADGSRMYVGTGDGGASSSGNRGPIWYSVDFGKSWNLTSISGVRWQSIACSGDGMTVFAAGSPGVPTGSVGGAYVSHDGGVTWTSNGIPQKISKAAASADGHVLIGGAGNLANFVYVSSDDGVTWAQANVPSAFWWALSCSWDGRRQIAMPIQNVYPCLSYDQGSTWFQETNTLKYLFWYSVASARDFSRLVAVARDSSGPDGSLYTSSDSGITWVSNSLPVVTWTVVACSADRDVMFAVGRQGVWMSRTNTPKRIEALLNGQSLTLSWTIPSNDAVLQERVDLLGASWTNSSSLVTTDVSKLQKTVTIPLTEGQKYFRLVSP
jgi:hypothetical protein